MYWLALATSALFIVRYLVCSSDRGGIWSEFTRSCNCMVVTPRMALLAFVFYGWKVAIGIDF